MRFSVLGSGSKGNATLIESGSTRLLIDNGFSGKEIARRLALLDVAPASLTAMLLTHEHDDHIRGVGVLARQTNITVCANGATHQASERTVGKIDRRCEFAAGEPFAIDGLLIHPFSLSHDAADPVGFVVSDGRVALGYCTDTGRITRLIGHHLRRCQALILEANHDPQMLWDGPYPLPLKQRVASSLGHLANEEAMACASELARLELGTVVLAHLSETNNHPDLVNQAARQQLGRFPRLRVVLADQRQACPFLTVEAGSNPAPSAMTVPPMPGKGEASVRL